MKTYVLDMDILLEYRKIIQINDDQPTNPNIDLGDAHLVIPEVVVRRLSEISESEPSRQVEGEGKRIAAAQRVLRILRNLVAGSAVSSMYDTCRLHARMMVSGSSQIVSILPVQKEVLQYLPFRLSEDDFDDQIIATAIMAGVALANLNTEGRLDEKSLRAGSFNDVVLLTNRDGLAVRARGYGIKTDTYWIWHKD